MGKAYWDYRNRARFATGEEMERSMFNNAGIGQATQRDDAYAGKLAASTRARDVTPTRLERLEHVRAELATRLADVDRAIELLKANPQLTEVIDAVERVGYL